MTRKMQVNDVLRGTLREIVKDIEKRYYDGWLDKDAVVTVHVTSETKEES